MSRLAVRHVVAHLSLPDARAPHPTDAELLVRFATARDEGAFAELVARHGSLVRGTARRLVRDPHAAEDVSQAAFLVLARKAGALPWTGTVAPWLHATTVRLARKALGRLKPVVAAAPALQPCPDPLAAAAWAEYCRALDEELAALPEVLRGPLVLCYLQGHTRDEAASQLGCALAMLKRRLERGRNLLRDRLTRRGVTLPAAGVGVLAGELTGAGAAEATAQAALAYVVRGTAPAGAAALLGAARAGLALKAVVLVAAGLVACGVALALPRSATEPPAAAKSVPDPTQDQQAAAADPVEPLPAPAITRLGSLRLRTPGSVAHMAFSPDGTKLAAWGGDHQTTNDLTIWDTKTGRALRRVELPGVWIGLLAFLPDGRGVALTRLNPDDQVPYLWEFTNERAPKPAVPKRKQLDKGSFAVDPNAPVPDNEQESCYGISPDGKVFAIGKAGNLEAEREVQLWELETGVQLNGLKPLKGGVINPTNCGELYFTPDSGGLVVFAPAKSLGNGKSESEQLVTAWNLKTGKQTAKFKAPRPALNGRPAVAVSNTTLAIGLEDGGTSLWDLSSGKEQKLATEHKSKDAGNGTFAVAFSPDGKALATGGRDNTARVWDVPAGKLRHALTGHHNWIETLTFSRDGKALAVSGQGGLIRLWNAQTGADACPLPGHKFVVWNVALGPDGRSAVTIGWDNTVRWWDVNTGTERRQERVSRGDTGLVLSTDGKAVLIATGDDKLRIWDRESGRDITPANLPAGAKFELLSFTPDGKHLVAASGPTVTICEWPALKLVRTIELPKPDKDPDLDLPDNAHNRCAVAAVSPDGKWLVTGAYCSWYRERDGLRYGYASHGVVDLWEFATGKRVRRLVDSKLMFRTGAFTADGKFVLVGGGGTVFGPDGSSESFEGEINLIDPVAGGAVRAFGVPPTADTVSHRYFGSSVLAPDGRTFYVSDNTGAISAFEVATGRVRRTLTGHRSYVGGLAVSADGRRLISGSHDSTALVWDLTVAGARAQRAEPLTESEADKLWAAVERDDAKAAYTALAELAGSPDRALMIVREHIKPARTGPTDAAVDRILTDLATENAATRAAASKELAKWGEQAVPAVRKRFAGLSSAEARQRLSAFLREFDTAAPSAGRRLEIRAVELLELMATPEARALLGELATGAANAPLTLDAAAALKRMRGY
jgi:RNA polymerase sigma factor (sigma-70 family)